MEGLVEFPPLESESFIPTEDYYFLNRSALGTDSLAIEVGGLSARVNGLPKPVLEAMSRRYSRFLSTGPARHSVTVYQGDRSYLSQPWHEPLRLQEKQHPQGRSLLAWYFAAFRSEDTGKLLVADPSNVDQTLRAVENYWRWLFCDMALEDSGFILHSAGIARDGKAYLFSGPSGAGKSTLTRLSRGFPVLSDDLVFVKRTERAFIAHTTPFFGSFPQTEKAADSYPISGLFLLKKSPEVHVSELNIPEGIGAMAAACPFLTGAPGRYEILLPLLVDFCSAIPPRVLSFRKDSTFWDCIPI